MFIYFITIFITLWQNLNQGKVPVWKTTSLLYAPDASQARSNKEDVFDMDCYGEEEFGPEVYFLYFFYFFFSWEPAL